MGFKLTLRSALLISNFKFGPLVVAFFLVWDCIVNFFLCKLCKVILVFLGRPGMWTWISAAPIEMRRMLGMRAGMKWTRASSLRQGGARGWRHPSQSCSREGGTTSMGMTSQDTSKPSANKRGHWLVYTLEPTYLQRIESVGLIYVALSYCQ